MINKWISPFLPKPKRQRFQEPQIVHRTWSLQSWSPSSAYASLHVPRRTYLNKIIRACFRNDVPITWDIPEQLQNSLTTKSTPEVEECALVGYTCFKDIFFLDSSCVTDACVLCVQKLIALVSSATLHAAWSWCLPLCSDNHRSYWYSMLFLICFVRWSLYLQNWSVQFKFYVK